jgi:hypothetical protein
MKNNYLKTAVFLISIGAWPISSFAQREVTIQNYGNTVDGNPLTTVRYENVTGNPYLTEGWNTALVKLKNGTTIREVKVKYDLVADELRFENKGKELLFVDPVEEFKIRILHNGKEDLAHYKKVSALNNGEFYEVLFEGTTSLYKKNRKIIVDKTPFNSATTVKVFEQKMSYFLYHKNKAVNVKNSEKPILNILNDKKPSLTTYIQKEKLDLKQDKDLIKLIVYYNSL